MRWSQYRPKVFHTESDNKNTVVDMTVDFIKYMYYCGHFCQTIELVNSSFVPVRAFCEEIWHTTAAVRNSTKKGYMLHINEHVKVWCLVVCFNVIVPETRDKVFYFSKKDRLLLCFLYNTRRLNRTVVMPASTTFLIIQKLWMSSWDTLLQNIMQCVMQVHLH